MPLDGGLDHRKTEGKFPILGPVWNGGMQNTGTRENTGMGKE